MRGLLFALVVGGVSLSACSVEPGDDIGAVPEPDGADQDEEGGLVDEPMCIEAGGDGVDGADPCLILNDSDDFVDGCVTYGRSHQKCADACVNYKCECPLVVVGGYCCDCGVN